jgi:flagellar basal-body rod modification protein FlgD
MTSFKIDHLKTATNTPQVKTSTSSSQSTDSTNAASSSLAISGTEFLTLLVHQLENQDPLNPMDNQEFAVQLAQFSSLEQLISINKALQSDTGSVSNLASYLGHEVVLTDQELAVSSGDGPNLLVDMPEGVQYGRIDLKDGNGAVVGKQDLTNLDAGRQVISLSGLSVPDGTYDARVVVVDETGKSRDLEAKVTGTVEGFVAEPEPKLIVNGQQVDVAQVAEVYAGKM